MVEKSIAIEYLTKNEHEYSSRWKNKQYLIVPNGITLPEIKNKIFSSFCIKASFIGRLDVYHKGIDLLLEAISLVKKELRSVFFHLSIYGHNQNNSKENINRIINDLCIADLVSVHDGVYGNEKIKVLRETDVFVHTSRFEGLPMSILEALSYGIPCLVTPGTNMDQIINKMDAGWNSEFNSAAISNVLKKIVEEKNVWKNKSNNARKLASAYSWDVIAKNAHDKYEELLRKINL